MCPRIRMDATAKHNYHPCAPQKVEEDGLEHIRVGSVPQRKSRKASPLSRATGHVASKNQLKVRSGFCLTGNTFHVIRMSWFEQHLINAETKWAKLFMTQEPDPMCTSFWSGVTIKRGHLLKTWSKFYRRVSITFLQSKMIICTSDTFTLRRTSLLLRVKAAENRQLQETSCAVLRGKY